MPKYADGSLLAFWYDSWFVLIGSAIALALALYVIATGNWKTNALALKTLMVLAVLAGFPLTMVRIGFRMGITNYESIGYISIVGTAVALIAGLPYVYRRYVEQRQAAIAGTAEPSTGLGGVTGQAEPEGLGPSTATFGQETPVPEPGGGTLAGGLGQTQASTAWLHFKSGPKAGQSVPLTSETVSVGRAEDNDVVIDDATVSRRHATISFQEGRFFVEDAGSMGGTMVEGEKATRTLLTSGASLQLGETEVVFMETEAPPATGIGPGTAAGPQAPGETMVMPQAQGVMAWLAITSGPQKGKSYQLKAGDNTIGRASDNDFAIEDTSISRRHAMIKVRDDSFLLVDLGSRTGTRVGETTLEGKVLSTGGVIEVGQTQLGLMEVEGGAPPEPATMSGETMVEQPGGGGGGVLIVRSGPDSGKSFSLSQGDNLIGRDPGSAVLLTDETVSRTHALIRREQDRFVVFDLGSRAGTRVDGESTVGHRLKAGDTISMGRTEMVLMQPGS